MRRMCLRGGRQRLAALVGFLDAFGRVYIPHMKVFTAARTDEAMPGFTSTAVQQRDRRPIGSNILVAPGHQGIDHGKEVAGRTSVPAP
jgi:hypothetical protein